MQETLLHWGEYVLTSGATSANQLFPLPFRNQRLNRRRWKERDAKVFDGVKRYVLFEYEEIRLLGLACPHLSKPPLLSVTDGEHLWQ